MAASHLMSAVPSIATVCSSFGNGIKPMVLPLQLGCWMTAPLLPQPVRMLEGGEFVKG
jgi:hypothetical protein